jgi:hypothetical protein
MDNVMKLEKHGTAGGTVNGLVQIKKATISVE